MCHRSRSRSSGSRTREASRHAVKHTVSCRFIEADAVCSKVCFASENVFVTRASRIHLHPPSPRAVCNQVPLSETLRTSRDFIFVATLNVSFSSLLFSSSPGRTCGIFDNEIVMMNHVYKERFPKVSSRAFLRLLSPPSAPSIVEAANVCNPPSSWKPGREVYLFIFL